MFEPRDWAAPLSIADLLNVVKRRWWMCLPPIAIAVTLAVVYTMETPPIYGAESEVVIRTEESANLFPLSDSRNLLRSPSAEVGFLESTEFELAAIAAADSEAEVSIDVGDVNSRVEPSFISFESRAGSPEEAARVAQAWAETYIDLRHERDASEITQTIETLEASLSMLELERQDHLVAVEPIDNALQLATESADISRLSTQRIVLLQALEPTLEPINAQVSVVAGELAELRLIADFFSAEDLSARINRTADVPDGPVSPSLPRNVLLAVIAGALLGAAVILIAEALDDRARSSDEVVERMGVMCLATVPMEKRKRQSIQIAAGPVAESFQRLASGVDFVAITGAAPKVIMCTSARESESKTTTVARLGVTLARQGRRTLIVGADLRRPSLAKQFDVETGTGLAEVLGGLSSAKSATQTVDGLPTLDLLRAGTIADNSSPVDLLRSDRFADAIGELRNHYDHILIDCPPVLPVVDALEVARHSDGIIMTVFAGRTRLGAVEKAQQMIEQASHTPLIGFVLTGAKKGAERHGYGRSYYGSDEYIDRGGYGGVDRTAVDRDARVVDVRPEPAVPIGASMPDPVIIQFPGSREAVPPSEVVFGGKNP